jgi:N4-gp56 family major capsid protein
MAGMYTSSMQAYRRLLNKDLQLATWENVPFFARGIGLVGGGTSFARSSVTSSSNEKLARPTGKPIEMLTNFQSEGSDTMDIVLKYPLTEAGVLGDAQILGTEEVRKIAYKKIRIAEISKGVKIKDAPSSEQVLKKPEIQKALMDSAQADLKDWFQRWIGFGIYDGFLKGASENVRSHFGLSVVSHPNFVVAGSGLVTFSSTPATYEGNVATALGGLSDTASDRMTVKAIKAVAKYASEKKIQKFQGYWHLVLHPDQIYQLKADSEYVNAVQYGQLRGDENPLFTGFVGAIDGVKIYEDENIPGVAVDTIPVYGNTNPLANPRYSTGNLRLGILYGASAIAIGQANPLRFENEDYDYSRKKTEAGMMTVGIERADIFDTDGMFGTAGFKENTSSLVLATYSPASVAWT